MKLSNTKKSYRICNHEIRVIRDRIKQHNVKVEHFAQVSTEEMKHAQSILDRVESTYHLLINKLRGS